MNNHSADSISSIQDSIIKYQNLMYTITIAILTFGLSAKESLILLLPYVIIFPICIHINQLRRDVCKVSAYIVCFEPDSISYLWEKRVQEYDLLNNTKGIHTSRLMNYCLAGMASICSIYKCFELNYSPLNKNIRITIAIVFFLLSIVFFKYSIVNYYEERKKQIQYWETVKDYELSSQCSKGTGNSQT